MHVSLFIHLLGLLERLRSAACRIARPIRLNIQRLHRATLDDGGEPAQRQAGRSYMCPRYDSSITPDGVGLTSCTGRRGQLS
jgi:hypothetical protein